MLDWIRIHPWAYPAFESAHLMGVAVLVGNLVLFELRVFGVGRALPLAALARLALPVASGGFALAAITGLAMAASQWNELAANRVFMAKLVLLFGAGANALWFHARGSLQRLDATARVQAVLSLGTWLAVLVCGRFIAYA